MKKVMLAVLVAMLAWLPAQADTLALASPVPFVVQVTGFSYSSAMYQGDGNWQISAQAEFVMPVPERIEAGGVTVFTRFHMDVSVQVTRAEIEAALGKVVEVALVDELHTTVAAVAKAKVFAVLGIKEE